MDSVIEQIKLFILSNETIFTINEILTDKDRSNVHQFCRDNDLLSQSVLKDGSTKKIIKVLKKEHVEKNDKEFVTPEMIEFFSRYAKIPILVPVPEYLDYYLEELNVFYDAKHQYEIFINDVKKYGSLGKLKWMMSQTEKSMINEIKDNKELIDLVNKNVEIPKIELNEIIYNYKNDGKTFVSIDIKSANYRVIKEYCPTLFQGEWYEYVSKHTDSEFIRTNKMFREIVFGMSNLTKKTQRCALIFVDEIDKYLANKDYYNSMKKVMCIADEIVYEIPETFDVKTLQNDVEKCKPNFFHIKMFKLKRIENRQFYIKEHTNGKLELKSTPSKFALQTIKKYFNKEIKSLDLKFIDEGMIATYDKPIY